jgi:hypothetical protein
MSVYESPSGDLWDGDSGEVIPAEPATAREYDARLVEDMAQLAKEFDGLTDWQRRYLDFSVKPGAAVLRHVARRANRLATDLRARAEQIDPTDPPVSEPPPPSR